MEKISATVICMKEEGNVQGCLESLDFVDEIVVIDSGATDGTLEICKSFTDRIIYHPWPSYGQQMNFAMDHIKNEWVLSLDTDEAVSPELKKNILYSLENDNGKYDGYQVNRCVFYLGRWIKHCLHPELKIRLFRKSKARWIMRDSHYTLNLDGNYHTLKGNLEHYPYRNISRHVLTGDFISSIGAKEKFEERKSVHLPSLFFNPLFRFFKLYIVKRGFLDGAPGFIISALESYYCFLKYAKLWEMKNVSPEKFFILFPNDLSYHCLSRIKNFFLRKQHQS